MGSIRVLTAPDYGYANGLPAPLSNLVILNQISEFLLL